MDDGDSETLNSGSSKSDKEPNRGNQEMNLKTRRTPLHKSSNASPNKSFFQGHHKIFLVVFTSTNVSITVIWVGDPNSPVTPV